MAKVSRKTLLISITALVAVVVIGLVILFLVRQNQTQQDTTQSLEGVPDYGACELVTTEVIRSAPMGDQIVTINEGARSGTDGLNGQQADSCTFAFSSNRAANNVVSVSVYPYSASEEEYTKEMESATWSEVSGPTPTPYFGATTIDNGKTSLYMLRVIPGAKTILLSLRQPEEAKTFTESDALNFLVDISKKMNFGAFERNAAQQAESETEGDGPGSPPENQTNDVIPYQE